MLRVVVLALENWLGAASLPRALTLAGFDVALLCYPNTLIALTRFAVERQYCQPTDGAEHIAARLQTLLEKEETRMVIPADERAQRFMEHIVEVSRLGVLSKSLTSLVTASLPNESAFRFGSDKVAATRMMAERGFLTPRTESVWTKGDLREFIEDVGLPVVLKPPTGVAGQGVRIFESAAEVDCVRLAGPGPWMVQRYIRGKAAAATSVALGGRCLAVVCFEKTLTYPGETGPTTLATRIEDESMHLSTIAFAEATGFNGFYSPGFIVDSSTGEAYLLEVNTRPVPMVPGSRKFGPDLCKALYCGLTGQPIPEMGPGAPNVMAFYPQELHRDPQSPNRHLILDEPTDDPEVHEAMERGIALLAASRA